MTDGAGTDTEARLVHLLDHDSSDEAELTEALVAHLRVGATGTDLLDGSADVASPALWRALSTPAVVRALETTIVRDLAVQDLLTAMRRGWALGGAPAVEHPHLASALAAQAFRTGYVFPAGADEVAAVRRAADHLPPAPEDLPAMTVALLAAYLPLRGWDDVGRVVDGVVAGRTPELAGLVRLQVLEPRREAELGDHLPRLLPGGESADDTTRLVAVFYEANPYPRWQRLPRVEPVALVPHLRAVLGSDSIPASGPPSDPELARPRVLVAGCGTGLHPLTLARRFPLGSVTALDLSRASLAYAARRTNEEGVPNIRFARADLTRLGEWDQTFHLVESVGVLQHLSDPEAGLRALASRLEPGGFMRLGVYARRGREHILQAQALAGEVLEEMREELGGEALRGMREELLPGAELSDPAVRELRARLTPRLAATDAGRRVLRHPDYLTLGEFRDLLLHPHEVLFTESRLRAAMEEQGLRFLGFEGGGPGASPGTFTLWCQRPH